MIRLFLIIPLLWAALCLVACGSDSSASSPDELAVESSAGQDSLSDYRSSGVVAYDSLGNPISSGNISADGGSSSSSSPAPVSVIEDTLIVDTTTVTDVNRLPECTAAIEGESFMVESENTLYFCLGGSWVESETVSTISRIGCRNGVLTVGEEDDETSTGGDVSMNPWGNLNGNTPSIDDSTAVPRRTAVRIMGVAQKGPFRYGTSVKIVELDSMQRLADSRRIHKTCILNADGNFSFDSVDLVSPYVRVEASGYFRNELTGGLSATPVTLNAVVDMSERDSVNVNMLTHMAAPRVMKLVENTGNNQPIGLFKSQALGEILSSFEIRLGGSSTGGGNTGFGNWGFGQQQQQQTTVTDGTAAEDVSLFDGSDYSGALLAVSIMMQRQGSGNDMLQYAAGIAERIKGNGNWDDNNAKADLADWLMALDTSGSFAKIRNNIASWRLGDVPEFEKHLRHFWTTVYNFGECNSFNADSVKFISNSLSAYFVSGYDLPGPKVRFICDATTHEWRAATDVEKDTYGLGAGEYEGQLKNGRVNTDKFYIYEQKKWRAATPDDIMDFTDIKDVYAGLKTGEKVVFFLRHAERSNDTGKNGHLTNDGKAQSQSVGEKLKGESIYFANSTYTRSKETCENIAIGAGTTYTENTIEELDGEWYVKNSSSYESCKSGNGGGWNVNSAYAYKGGICTDAFYNFEERSEQFLQEIVKPHFANVKRVGVWISHDTFVVPLTAYCSDRKVNWRYFDTKQWANYLAGIAIIMDSKGNLRYVPVKGLESGSMTM
ncbi:histidine phosphatase family protein [uncultured Fibrobacter sp.]|uniref:histidine phosphatase family protein n=1 Tax=uncultured Fibrobacter sp. TaxID=261512 RepID=UPI00262C84A7|nr:histidine phosphatase family protein [uncultured Fibrobacter sp.]